MIMTMVDHLEYDASMSGSTVQDEWRDPTMDLETPAGSIVIFTGKNGLDGENAIARSKLAINGEYEVERINIGGFVSYVYLKGQEGSFNTVMFRNAGQEPAPIRKPATPPDTLLRDALEALKPFADFIEHSDAGMVDWQKHIQPDAAKMLTDCEIAALVRPDANIVVTTGNMAFGKREAVENKTLTVGHFRAIAAILDRARKAGVL